MLRDLVTELIGAGGNGSDYGGCPLTSDVSVGFTGAEFWKPFQN